MNELCKNLSLLISDYFNSGESNLRTSWGAIESQAKEMDWDILRVSPTYMLHAIMLLTDWKCSLPPADSYIEISPEYWARKWNEVWENDIIILREKAIWYGDSWVKRGGVGAFFSMVRKYDRAENIVKSKGIKYYNWYHYSSEGNESMEETLDDLRRYLFLIVSYKLSYGGIDTAVSRLKTAYELKIFSRIYENSRC